MAFPRLLPALCAFGALSAMTPLLGRLHAEQSEANGIVVVEAEAFDVNHSPRSSRSWELADTVAGFSGTGYMQAVPNSGSNIAAGNSSPELQFRIIFANPGTYQIWIRGRGETPNDDSCHVGLNGGASVAVSLNSTGSWQWSNTNFSTGGSATITVPSAGLHTVNVWMREDGFQLDRLVLTRNAGFLPQTGNAWHLPANKEPATVASMRAPLLPEGTNQITVFTTGNQFQGAGGNPGNQTQTNSALLYRVLPGGTWQERPMTFLSEVGNNKYFSASIPALAASPGQTVEYYFRIAYSDRLPTYVHGTDAASATSEFESAAQADPFLFEWRPGLAAPGGAHLTLTNGSITARIHTATGHVVLAYTDRQGAPAEVVMAPPAVNVNGHPVTLGAVLAHEEAGSKLLLQQSCGGASVATELGFTDEGVLQYEVTGWAGLATDRIVLQGSSPASEQFFGLGEKFNSVNQTGLRTHILNFDAPGNKGDRSYKVTPWFLSTRGYGLHLDSTAESWFDLRASSTDRFRIESLHQRLLLRLIAGPEPGTVLSRYVRKTGLPALPPPWVFGTWISSDIWRNGGEVRYAVTKHRNLGIPASVFVFDSPWSVGYNDFTWNAAQWSTSATMEGTNYLGFATPADMLAFLRTNGLKAVCWMTPFVNVSSVRDSVGGVPVPGQNTNQAANYAEGAAQGHFVRSSPGGPPLVVPWWKGSGSPVDFTREASADWLRGQLQNLVNASAVGGSGPVVGGFKTDDGEYRNDDNIYIPLNASYADGRTGVEMRNGYSITYHKAVWQVMGSNGVLFARGGFTGSQAYTAYWGGDNEPNFKPENGMQSVIVSGLSAGLSGFSIWGHDIGGYLNSDGVYETNPEDLFMRWTQFGAFSPIMQMHRQVNPANLRQYPWGYGTTGLTNYRDYAKLHSQLFPYIYSYAKRASETGLPIMQHPVLLHPDDTNTHRLQHTYYFGDEMLVAPVVAPMATNRNVYLPAGSWRDFWTGELRAGGQLHTWTNTNRSLFPVFIREGSIIPMLPTAPQTLCDAAYVANPDVTTPDSSLEVLIHPGPGAAFTMHDGTTFVCSVQGQLTRADVNSAPRDLLLKLRIGEPGGVERNGVRIPATSELTPAEQAASPAHWWHDSASGYAFVLLRHAGGPVSITTSPAGPSGTPTASWNAWHALTGSPDGDTDGDGATDRAEYLAGTDPRSPASALRAEVAPSTTSPGAFRVRWHAVAGIRYRLEWKELLENPGWNLLSRSFLGGGSLMEWTDDGSETGSPPTDRRFYRVLAPVP